MDFASSRGHQSFWRLSSIGLGYLVFLRSYCHCLWSASCCQKLRWRSHGLPRSHGSAGHIEPSEAIISLASVVTSWLQKAHIEPRKFATEVVSFGYLLATIAASLIFDDFVH
jgi:hypothetical protein